MRTPHLTHLLSPNPLFSPYFPPILNWVMKLNLFMCFLFFIIIFFLFLFLKHPWKVFHSIHLFFELFSLDTYKHARRVACIFLVNFFSKLPMKLQNSKKNPRKNAFSSNLETWISQLFLKTSHETLKFQKKAKKNAFFSNLQTWIPKNFPFGVYHGAKLWSYWTKQIIKKLNLWGETGAGKSAWRKVCFF